MSTQRYINYKSKPGNQQKLAARRQCSEAIRKGELVRQPCETCGASKTEAHHDDYSLPLKVRWLCKSCHGAVHGSRNLHCRNGHQLFGHNVRISIEDGAIRRRCRRCHTEATWKRRGKL